MSLSPQVPPVVGPVVTVALARLKLPVVVVVEPAAAGTVAAFCLTWPTDLLVAQGGRGQ